MAVALELMQAGAGGGFALAEEIDPAALPAGGVEGLYVHVPFCFHKCHYCDFYSITRQTPERMDAFVGRVLKEAARWVELRGREEGVRTVFFGGGTPSLLSADAMVRLVVGLRETLGLVAVDEWTVECNPATVDEGWLGRVREAGVDRLSFGAQSFRREDLAALERHHEPDDVPKALEMARRAGFERLNIDMIFGVPGQTLADWEASLGMALACGTKHVSAYLLTYEQNTPMAVKKRLGQLVPAEESLELSMLSRTREMMRARGLMPYEISNFAVAGEACRHNLMYWNGGSYLGLGPSAASHVHGWRWRNRPHIGEWERAVDAGRLPTIEEEHLAPDRREAELAYLMSRLAGGVDYAVFTARTGGDARRRFTGVVERLVKVGLVEADEAGFRLTEKGIAVADGVGAELLA